MANAWGGSFGVAWGVSWGSTTPTPTPTPTATLPGAGNAAGHGTPHTTGNTYTDIARWTRRGTAVRVKAESVQTRRTWLQTYAGIRPHRTRQSVEARAVQVARVQVQGIALARPWKIRMSAVGITEATRALSVTATAQQTERQDVADILAIIDLLEQLDGEE